MVLVLVEEIRVVVLEVMEFVKMDKVIVMMEVMMIMEMMLLVIAALVGVGLMVELIG